MRRHGEPVFLMNFIRYTRSHRCQPDFMNIHYYSDIIPREAVDMNISNAPISQFPKELDDFANRLGNGLLAQGDGYFITRQNGCIQIITCNYVHYGDLFAAADSEVYSRACVPGIHSEYLTCKNGLLTKARRKKSIAAAAAILFSISV